MLRLTPVLLCSLIAVGLLACDENDPTGTDLTTTSEGGRVAVSGITPNGDTSVAISTSTASLLGSLPLPVNQSLTSNLPALYIAQKGTGGVADFRIENASNGNIALTGRTIGMGTAVAGITPAGTGGTGVAGIAYGGGMAGHFQIANQQSGQIALLGQTDGFGPAVKGISTSGIGGWFEAAGPHPAINARAVGTGHVATFTVIPATSAKSALRAQSYGTGPAVNGVALASGNAALFENTYSNTSQPVVAVMNKGGGYAAVFQSTTSLGRGVLVKTNGGAGLQVIGGSKNAVVATPSGSKALYTEESTEVWFTDYGFGTLANGKGRILFDPSFAQTINPDESYHVFVQSYGRAELYVAERTPLGFTVALKDGDPNAEFSYRIVAKRLGFEGKRLEAAPWADELPVRY
jgi:hypothetical protein